ncbi:hypothetical protein BKA69DRAFT_1124788 [Paraphysoderma sedebokerense]|nr:hypothetical protein BKA69DRAFT_1124788 [Paraphysoderma sedebokerense]
MHSRYKRPVFAYPWTTPRLPILHSNAMRPRHVITLAICFLFALNLFQFYEHSSRSIDSVSSEINRIEYPDFGRNFKPYQRLAIVIPFTHSEISRTLTFLRSWKKYDLCRSELPPVAKVSTRGPTAKYTHNQGRVLDMLLYFHRDWDRLDATTSQNFLTGVNEVFKNHSDCITNWKVVSAKLTPQEDSYPGGPSNQFYKIFEEKLLDRQYDCFFWMEADVYPIRQYWADALFTECFDRGRFWYRGSINRSPHEILTEDNQEWAGHINGNAIYKLGDEQFRSVILQTKQHMNPNTNQFPFDVSLWRLTHHPHWWRIFQSNAHKIAYSNFIQNLMQDVTEESLQKVRVNDPDTFFVHGHLIGDTPGKKPSAVKWEFNEIPQEGWSLVTVIPRNFGDAMSIQNMIHNWKSVIGLNQIVVIDFGGSQDLRAILSESDHGMEFKLLRIPSTVEFDFSWGFNAGARYASFNKIALVQLGTELDKDFLVQHSLQKTEFFYAIDTAPAIPPSESQSNSTLLMMYYRSAFLCLNGFDERMSMLPYLQHDLILRSISADMRYTPLKMKARPTIYYNISYPTIIPSPFANTSDLVSQLISSYEQFYVSQYLPKWDSSSDSATCELSIFDGSEATCTRLTQTRKSISSILNEREIEKIAVDSRVALLNHYTNYTFYPRGVLQPPKNGIELPSLTTIPRIQKLEVLIHLLISSHAFRIIDLSHLNQNDFESSITDLTKIVAADANEVKSVFRTFVIVWTAASEINPAVQSILDKAEAEFNLLYIPFWNERFERKDLEVVQSWKDFVEADLKGKGALFKPTVSIHHGED